MAIKSVVFRLQADVTAAGRGAMLRQRRDVTRVTAGAGLGGNRVEFDETDRLVERTGRWCDSRTRFLTTRPVTDRLSVSIWRV